MLFMVALTFTRVRPSQPFYLVGRVMQAPLLAPSVSLLPPLCLCSAGVRPAWRYAITACMAPVPRTLSALLSPAPPLSHFDGTK